MPVIEGGLDGTGARVAIVSGRFNHVITRRLFESAVKRLAELGCTEVDEVWVPGAFELPLAAQALADRGCYDGIIAIGVVIRGDTPHFDYVCRAATDGISEVALSSGLPVAFCVLTTDNADQALARASIDGGVNKGAEAAEVVVEMMGLLRGLGSAD
jgi:6,7-dimethyl-8-ribityllumazine synthase